MQRILVLICLISGLPLWANMASPYGEGSELATTFINRNARVLSEKLTIVPDSSFSSAYITAHYSIYMDSAGTDIPLLFVAREYEGDFSVEVDGEEVETKPLSEMNIGMLSELPPSWRPSIKEMPVDSASSYVAVAWSFWNSMNFAIEDLIYFETNLDTGLHDIYVYYKARVWSDGSDWVDRYFLSYSLSPAKYWRDFGTLEVTLDTRNFPQSLSTNLGEPTSGSLDDIAKWQFDKLPVDVLTVEYEPEISGLAEVLIGVGPGWISIICIAPFIFIQILLLCRFEKKKSPKFNPWILIGGVGVPIIWALIYFNSFEWIYSAIGDSASRRQGYMSVMVVFIVPILMLIYSLVNLGLGRLCKND